MKILTDEEKQLKDIIKKFNHEYCHNMTDAEECSFVPCDVCMLKWLLKKYNLIEREK